MSHLITVKIRRETHAKLRELRELTGVTDLHRLDQVISAELNRARRRAQREEGAAA